MDSSGHPNTSQRVVITGGAGTVATLLRTRLARPDRILRLTDTGSIPPAADGERVEIQTADVTDAAAMRAACRDADALIHLGGVSAEHSWQRILDVNIDGSHTVLEAARAEGVRRVILASSNHAVGFYPRDAPKGGLPDDVPPRPDTYYGVSKAALEALGALYADRFVMNVFCLRIGWCVSKPPNEFALAMWLSPDDCGRLLEACLSTARTGYRVIWGASANTRRYWSYAGGEAIGYHPRDDSERFADRVEPEPAATRDRLGGWFTTAELGKPM